MPFLGNHEKWSCEEKQSNLIPTVWPAVETKTAIVCPGWPSNRTSDIEKNNRVPHPCLLRLFASFPGHIWIETGVITRKLCNWATCFFCLFCLCGLEIVRIILKKLYGTEHYFIDVCKFIFVTLLSRQEEFLENIIIKWPTVVLMPKIWNLKSRIIFSSRIECSPVPSRNMTKSTLKMGSKSWVLVSEVKWFKTVVRCLAWVQIKPVDSLNHLKLFTNHNCLTK